MTRITAPELKRVVHDLFRQGEVFAPFYTFKLPVCNKSKKKVLTPFAEIEFTAVNI
jgi:hypothetical protein